MALLNTSEPNPQAGAVRCGSSSDGGGEEQPGCKSGMEGTGGRLCK
ncbi:FHA domain-containing protein DDL, partial [Fusarium oxysporum f. sp. albedinis]